MSFHFCAHSWEVRDMADGTLIKLSRHDLDADAVSGLVDDLLALVLESGTPNLYLDFADVNQLASMVMGKLVSLNTQLAEHGGRLTVLNVKPMIYDMFKAVRLTDVLDIRAQPAAETIMW